MISLLLTQDQLDVLLSEGWTIHAGPFSSQVECSEFATGTSTFLSGFGRQNEVAWYSTDGVTLTGLPTAPNGILVTNAQSVPSIGKLLAGPNISINQVGNQITISGTGGGGGGGTTYSADETTLHLSGTTFSIISTYIGQTSIVTLGTVTTGTWHGTKIAQAYGGTNVDSSASTGIAHVASGTWTFSAVDLSGADATGILAAGRFPALTGDVTTSAGALATALATVNSNVGTFGSATQSAQVTVNGKGLVTAVANVTITPAASSITGGAALTRTNDTNVTITLGGTPASALLAAVSLTMGWSGQLSIARGGTGVSSVTTAPTATAWAGWDANSNLSANSFIEGYTTTATNGGTTTLAVGSTEQQYFTGSSTETVTLPDTSTLVKGQQFQVVNLSSGTVTVQSNGSNTVQAMAANTSAWFTCVSTSVNTAAAWQVIYQSTTTVSVPVTSVFSRTGAVVAVSGDYTAAQVTNAFDVTAAATLTEVAAPSSPASGFGAVWFDSTDHQFHSKNHSGTIGTTVVSSTAGSHQFATAVSAAGVVTWTTLASGDVTNALGFTPISGNQTITLSGDTSGSGATAITVTVSSATLSDSTTNTSPTAFTIKHETSGSVANSFGLTELYTLNDTTTVDSNAANWNILWATAAHATRKARVIGNVYDTAAREWIRGEASGTAPMIGFLGAAASAALASPDLGTLATTFGLATGTPTFSAANVTNGAALTRTNDTNVTLTLGGTPSTALLVAASLTLGWSGQLALSRGGTGLNAVPTDGQLLIGRTSDNTLQLATLTQGGGVTVTNGGATITFGFNASNVTTGTLPIANGGSGSAFYGDGSDGSQTFDGSTTILGMVPSGSVYTMTRDIYCTSITINSGVTLLNNGWRIHCTGTLTCNSNGASGHSVGVGADGGTGGNGGAASPGGAGRAGGATGNAFFSLGVSNAGGTGGVNGAGQQGNPNSGSTGFGSAGGGGGAATNAGGSAGTAPTAPTAASGSLRALPQSVTGGGWSLAGSGGGGGGSNSTNAGGGGGGGGGGACFIAAKTIAGSGTIGSPGGNGGNGGGTSGNAGAGGGGGGGVLQLFYTSLTVTTVTVAGGTHGTAFNSGASGSNGTDGVKITFSA